MIELKYAPKTGQVPYPTGAMQAGVPVPFHWKTPSTGIVNFGENGNLFFTTPSDNNTTFDVTFNGKTIQLSGPSSGHWAFGPGTYQVKMLPDTDYNGTVVAQSDTAAGLTIKMNAR